MHHEVLLVLSGHPGNTFAVSRESGLYEVIPDLPFIHPSEVALLNRISRLGTYYLQLKDFISLQNAFSVTLTPADPEGGSQYLKALAYGLDRVLDAYRQKLVTMEEKCISDPHLPLSHLQHEFEDYQFLLPTLDSCVKYVHRHKLHGCQILSYLHKQCSSGIPVVQTAFQRILTVCHGVLYKQLSSWMLHGLLLDQRGEFFIEKVEELPLAQNKGMDEEEEGIQLPSEPQSVSNLAAQDTSPFRINHSLTPSYLPLRVVEKILFIGEAVQIFQNQNTSDGYPPLPSFIKGSGPHLKGDQLKFSQMLSKLQAQPVFQLREVESTIDFIRDAVAQHLRRLLVEESDLVGHLQIIKDFFLLGRGELFLAFVDLADSFMKQPPTRTTEHDVNVAFQQAMMKIGIDHEELTKQFKLVVNAPLSELGKVSAISRRKSCSWKHIGMTHAVSWPLHVVFTPTALKRYSSLFQFLLSLRRAQVALQQSWAKLMQFRDHVDTLQSVWQLRTLMGFLIDNLQYYVQVDVLETQFSVLVDKIRSTHDFETIKQAHENYISTLQSQLFSSQSTVKVSHGLTESLERCLAEIFELCFSFSDVIQGLCGEKCLLTREDNLKISQIEKDFRRQSSLLFKVLSSVKSHQSTPHLAQLLLRVDYNKYFSSKDQ